MNPKTLLDSFKKTTSDRDLLPILADKRLLMVVWSWTKIRVEWKPPATLEDAPENEFDQWDLLWRFSEWNFEDLAFLVSVSNVFAAKLFERARRFRLVFPDGTISEDAANVITRYMARVSGESLAPRVEAPEEGSGGDGYEQ